MRLGAVFGTQPRVLPLRFIQAPNTLLTTVPKFASYVNAHSTMTPTTGSILLGTTSRVRPRDSRPTEAKH